MERGGKMSAPSASWESTLQRVKELPTLNNVYLYLYLTRRNSDRHEFVSASNTFLFMRLHDTSLTMNSDRSVFVSVAGTKREILVPV